MHLYLRGLFGLVREKKTSLLLFSGKDLKATEALVRVSPVGHKDEQDKSTHFYGAHSFYILFYEFFGFNCLPLSCQLKSFS